MINRRQSSSIAGIIAAVVVGGVVAWAGGDAGQSVGSITVFALCGLLAFTLNWVAFIPANLARTEHYFDLTGSITYIIMIWVAVGLSENLDARSLIVAGMVTVWAGRLGTFLYRRVRAAGHDRRFDRIKTDPLRFLMTWTLQGLWVLLTSACALAVITASQRRPIGWVAGVGITVWLVGFGLEVVADRQKSVFRSHPENADRFITSGVWARSRHPNYLGEIILWTGIAIISLPILGGWSWVCLISPLFVTILLTRISGIPMLEARALARWGDDPEFRTYMAQTPRLIPRLGQSRT